jgi:hypothetical protein
MYHANVHTMECLILLWMAGALSIELHAARMLVWIVPPLAFWVVVSKLLL